VADTPDSEEAMSAALQVDLPRERIHGMALPITRFLGIQSASGGLLLVGTILVVILSNSAMRDSVESFWETPLSISWGFHQTSASPRHWINEGLMVIFFFVVGPELKREFILGELNSWRSAVLSLSAAIEGMIVPGGVYLSLQWNAAGQSGWGIPMTTDIALWSPA
jgi:NhaA family Na+:H+ antiporter